MAVTINGTTGITTPDVTTEALTTTGDVNFGDNDKAIFGADSDLQIYNDGTNSWIDETTAGNMFIRGNGLYLQKYTGEPFIDCIGDGVVRLYYDNAAKLQTLSTGVDVTGTVTAESLGIGESSPSAPLHITTTSQGTLPALQADADNLLIEDQTPGITLMGANNGGGMIAFGDVSDADVGRIFYYHPTNSMSFWANAAEAMRITSNGRLCVGTTDEDSSIVNIERTDHTQFGLKIEQTSGTVNFTIAELLRLKLNGNGAETPFQRFYGGATELGEIRINSTSNGTQYLTTSDYRLKENVVDMTDSITRLKQLRPVNYNFIGNDVVTDGFLAHEVQDVIPSAVGGQKDAVKEDGSIRPQMIEMSSMIPLLTAALQEAIAKIETLETTVADLRTRVNALETAE